MRAWPCVARIAEQFFDAYLDGELSGSLQGSSSTPTACAAPSASKKLAMMEACAHLLSGDNDAPAVPDDFTDRLMHKLEGPRVIRVQQRKQRILGAAGVFATAAAVVAVAFFWPVDPASNPVEPTLDPANRIAGVTVTNPKLDDVFREKDKPELYRYIWERVDQMVAAGNRIKQDVGAVRDYALNWTIPDTGVEQDPVNPLRGILDAIAPANEGDKKIPAPESPDQHVL